MNKIKKEKTYQFSLRIPESIVVKIRKAMKNSPFKTNVNGFLVEHLDKTLK